MQDVTRYDPLQASPLPLYGSWGQAEYESLGFMVGLEVHQQLLTERKLFCRCPAGLYTRKYDAQILRHMRPTLSEMGDYDGTALMEFKTRKEITYQLKTESVCTYEMDDAPPFELDPVALEYSILISMLLGLQLVDEVHIARKQYLDGSIPTGFQRTAIIGVSGAIPFRGREIGIRQLSIEEDSCREVSDRGHDRIYSTDRLGMPLVESVTDPDMRTPEEAAAVCELLRRLVRVTGRVRTGSGAGRQDVNVSIRGGRRVEIKGVSNIREIPVLVHNEALRQRSLLAIREVLRERGVSAEGIDDRHRDVTSVVQGTEWGPLRDALENDVRVAAVPLPGFEGLIGTRTQPNTRFLKEFSDRIRVVACIDTLPNVICSTGETETLSSAHWTRIQKRCGVDVSIPILVVWGAERDVATAVGEILLRAREACEGVPDETRQSLPDGTTGFERVLPGPSRMYPDTDLPPAVLDRARIAELRSELPLTPWARRERLDAAGVGADLARRLSIHPAYELFELLVKRLGDAGLKRSGLTATGLASLLLDRDLGRPPRVSEADPWWYRVADQLADGRCCPEGVRWGKGEPIGALEASEARRLFEAAQAELPADLPAERGPRQRAIMGYVMRELRGRVPGRTVANWVLEAEA